MALTLVEKMEIIWANIDVTREDIEDIGYDSSEVDDERLKTLKEGVVHSAWEAYWWGDFTDKAELLKELDLYVEDHSWGDLGRGLERMHISRKMSEDEKAEWYEDRIDVGFVSREDLDKAGFDIVKVDDDTMRKLARNMVERYRETVFWIDVKEHAESLGIPQAGEGKKKNENNN
jgi:hypothetical protein